MGNYRKKRSPAKKNRPKETPKRRLAARILMILAIPIFIGLIWTAIPGITDRTTGGPAFQKEGTLQFVDQSGEVLAGIDIEIAADDLERERGLMWRRSMASDQGMLFMMERSEPQSFWMLNTYLSLDILFVDADRQIVNIIPGTEPQSLDPVHSTGPAKYVVEVLAGFCADNGIEPGDRIIFERVK